MGFRNGSDLIQALDECATIEDIRNICHVFCRSYGFDGFLLCLRVRTARAGFHRHFIDGAGGEGITEGITEGIGPVVDGVLALCAGRVTPLWIDPQRMGEVTGGIVRDAVCLPIHRSNGGDMALVLLPPPPGRAQDSLPVSRLAQAGLFAAHLDEATRGILSADPGSGIGINLTERERECLLWVAEGKTIRETAAGHGISERTVVYHLQNAMDKLKAVNRCHAVARAMAAGLVSPRFG